MNDHNNTSSQHNGDRSEERDDALRDMAVDVVLDAAYGIDAANLERNITSGLSMIDAESQSHPRASPAHTSVYKHNRTGRRWYFSLAGLLALVLAAVYLMPGERSLAIASVNSAAAQLRSQETRRFHVWLEEWDGPVASRASGAEPTAVIDARPPNITVIVHRPPWEKEYRTAGRDEQGMWYIDDTGSIVRQNSQRGWPPWTTIKGQSLFDDSLATLIQRLEHGYTLKRERNITNEQRPGRVFDRITADRNDTGGPTSRYVELWFDHDSGALDLIIFRWEDTLENRGTRAREDGRMIASEKSITFERVASPQLDADWFLPEHHSR